MAVCLEKSSHSPQPLVQAWAGPPGLQVLGVLLSAGATAHRAIGSPWYEPERIVWMLLITGAAAAGTAFWAAILRRQVQARTKLLEASLQAQRQAHLFDAARNEVLEGIAQNSALAQNMERLTRAIEEQVTGCACAIVMPPDGRSFHNGKPAPVLIAPSIGEELHPLMLPALSNLLNPGAGSYETAAPGEEESIADLVRVLREANLDFASGRMTVVLSGTGEAAGLLILFLPTASSHDSLIEQNVIQSACRLVSLAGDHSRMHERLLREARHDGLTGLPNRTVAEDRLEQALARAERTRKQFAVFGVDLDGFKAINDEFGHDTGDELLRAVSQRLRNNLRHSDTLARMGGDEFLVLIEDCSGPGAALSVAQSLVTTLQEAFVVDGADLRVSASIGVALYPSNGRNAAQLRRNADLAMYRAKGLGGSQVALWSVDFVPTPAAAQKISAR